MGYTLFPATTQSTQLEQLAGVPLGTIARLRQFEQDYPQLNNPTNDLEGYEAYSLLDEELKLMRDLESLGLGKLRHCDLIHLLGTDSESKLVTGFTDDPILTSRLLKAAGSEVDPTLCEGLHWS